MMDIKSVLSYFFSFCGRRLGVMYVNYREKKLLGKENNKVKFFFCGERSMNWHSLGTAKCRGQMHELIISDKKCPKL